MKQLSFQFKTRDITIPSFETWYAENSHERRQFGDRAYSKKKAVRVYAELLEGGIYHNGYFACSISEFKRVAKKGHEVKSGISPAVEFGGTTYVISLSKFITFWKEMEIENETMVGIPRIYWKEV